MAFPPWALDALMRGVGSVVDKVPPETVDQLRQRASRLLDELPETAARGVDTVFRGAKATKQVLQRWAQQHLALVTPAINASGCLFDERLVGGGQADPLVEWAAGLSANPVLRVGPAAERLNRRLERCGGSDQGVLVATSVEAACLAVGLARGDQSIYLHRSQSHRLPSGTAIPDAFRAGPDESWAAGAIHEVGSVDGVSPSDANGLPSGAILVAVDHGDADPIWYAGSPNQRGSAGGLRVVLMTLCGGIEPGDGFSSPNWLSALSPLPRFVSDHLRPTDGRPRADCVITPGDGLLGGPPCGLIVGRRETLERIAASPAWLALQASPITRAMMTTALESLQGAPFPQHPTALALTTSEENLKNRAERLAIRLTADESIATVQITAAPASLTKSGVWRTTSRQLQIRHRDRTTAQWARSLAESFPAVLATESEGGLVIDLRWVRPADDATLATALLGESVAGEAPSETAAGAEPFAEVPPGQPAEQAAGDSAGHAAPKDSTAEDA